MAEHDVHESTLDDPPVALPPDRREFLKTAGCGVFVLFWSRASPRSHRKEEASDRIRTTSTPT